MIRDGNFLAVVAKREFQAIKAMRMLAASVEWDETAQLPIHGNLADVLVALPSRDLKVFDNHQDARPAVRTLEASYSRPYQSHGSIGPSCAVAQLVDGVVSVWTHTQGVYPDRAAIAEMLRLPPDKVRCIHVEGSGCYGHNGADDAAGDAALVAAVMPGTPIRLDARAGTCMGALWAGYGDEGLGRARRDGQGRRLALGSVEQHTFDAAGLGRLPPPGPACGQTLPPCRHRSLCPCPKEAGTATPSRSTSSRMRR